MAKETNYKFIRISSTRDITVSCDLSKAIDQTDPTTTADNRLKVKEFWSKTQLGIVRGTGYYPECVKEWTTVKKLDEIHVIDVLEKTYTLEQLPEQIREGAKAMYDQIVKNDAQFERENEQTKRINKSKIDAIEKRTASMLAGQIAKQAE